MTEPSHPSTPDDPGRLAPGGRPDGAGRPVRAALVALAAVILGTALLGAATGFLWATLAPRALAVVVGRGSANLASPETNAYIAADAWFTLLTVGGGVISGLLGYALAVRRHGALAMTGILVGGLAATLIAMWIGQHSGAAAFNHGLAIGRPGTLLRVPLMLGGRGPLAFWPLAAGLAAGGSEAVVLLRERRRRPAPLHGYAPPPRYGLAIPSTGPHAHAGHDGHPAPGGPSGQRRPGPDGPPRLAGPREPGPATDPRD
jgi:hypothetical protein